MRRTFTALSGVILLLGYGVAEGLWTGRWRPSPHLAEAPQRLARLARTLGPWEGRDEELSPRQVRQAELSGYLLRCYTHRETGESLTVLAVSGRSGPVSAHTPAVCFRGGGFVPSRPRVRHSVKTFGLSAPAEFWAERYQKEGAVPEHLLVYYGWNPSSGWLAPDHPRLAFASAPALYKLYVVQSLPRSDESMEKGPIPHFLRLFVPELQRCLFEAP